MPLALTPPLSCGCRLILGSELLNDQSAGGATTVADCRDTLFARFQCVQESDEDTGAR